ncbi:Hypothetical predicted protein [Olea europaea subsp. europaea]|uniref:Uncharacterized protein n=1 Tax=Olea europaea subsp. europaea TaxID=158383 RepID=A0A8S0SLU5_OLEEU|nr:Hypothetical predicted protein [Olea europaea subsp. europaea]
MEAIVVFEASIFAMFTKIVVVDWCYWYRSGGADDSDGWQCLFGDGHKLIGLIVTIKMAIRVLKIVTVTRNCICDLKIVTVSRN